jgi:tetratricopeptide (TPR) repeat protein
VNYLFNVGRIHQVRGNEDDLKIAEAIYKNILEKNDKDANVHFSLGLVYEKTKRTKEASEEYKKVLELIPSDNKTVRSQIQKMIDNIAKGIENTAENLKIVDESQPIVSSENSGAENGYPQP